MRSPAHVEGTQGFLPQWEKELQAEILGKYANDVFIKPNYFTDVQYFKLFLP